MVVEPRQHRYKIGAQSTNNAWLRLAFPNIQDQTVRTTPGQRSRRRVGTVVVPITNLYSYQLPRKIRGLTDNYLFMTIYL